jgi:P27 family predicted phage terminase small subunit
MDGPGRRSAASLSVATAAPWARLEPPDWLTEDAANVWKDVVATKPSDWFQSDSAPLLEAYCKSVVEYRRAAAALDATPPADLSTYKTLVDITTKLAGQMTSLATKMRLTQQARYTTKAAGTADRKVTTAKPWSA